MPFEVIQPGVAARPGRWAWLRSQGLGLICGQATVLLLAVGSFVLVATAEGASKNVGMDSITGFFSEPSVVHTWFYLLIVVMLLYALNTLLATWESVARKWRNGVRSPQLYAASVIHVGFLVAMVAHLVGGVWGGDEQPVVLTSEWTELSVGRAARLASLHVERNPDGGIKQVYAHLELREAEILERATVTYNGPLSYGFGSELYLLVRQQESPPAIMLRCRRAPGNPVALLSALFMLVGMSLMWRRFAGFGPREVKSL